MLHLVLVAAAGLGHVGEALDEGGEHFLHLLLGLDHAALGLCLLEDHVLQAALHIVQAAQGEQLCRGGHQGLGLALEPVVIHAQCGNVAKHHVQQFQQHGAHGRLVFGSEKRGGS